MKQAYPRILTVEPLPGHRLLVGFDNGVSKIYNCSPLLEKEAFRLLREEAFFRAVHPDPHGYAVVWDDKMDLAEAEIWVHGETVKPGTRV
jgi:hypothetical protein